jgi:uncharacterized membrane protein YbaN (DUF454 family)
MPQSFIRTHRSAIGLALGALVTLAGVAVVQPSLAFVAALILAALVFARAVFRVL